MLFTNVKYILKIRCHSIHVYGLNICLNVTVEIAQWHSSASFELSTTRTRDRIMCCRVEPYARLYNCSSALGNMNEYYTKAYIKAIDIGEYLFMNSLRAGC